MWPKDLLHVSWSSSRGTSPVREQRGVGEPGSATSLPEGVSTTTGLCERRHVYTHHDAISSVRLLDENIVIGGVDGTVRQCKLGAGATGVVELVRSQERVSLQAISKDGRWIVLVGHEGRRIAVWDAITGQRSIEFIDAHEQNITALDISSDASKIASGSRDGIVSVWCLETGQHLAGPFQQQQGILSVRFSPQGDRLASIGWRSIHVWNVCSDDEECIIPTDSAYSLAWSNDGRRLFAGSSRGSTMCFNLSAPTPVMPEWRCNPHFDAISTLCLSNNGKFIVSASHSECRIKIWDVHTRSQLASLEHPSVVLDAEVSPDDGHLVSGTKDGKVFLWDIRKVLGAPYFFYSLTTPMLTSPSDSYLILTEISNAAYISWRKAELVRAEQILSSEIGCKPLNSSCYHLANRALVRARLRQWDGALDDAQLSFLLKPSLVARLAMGITQSGHENYHAAIETLDLALEICDQAERNFVNVIKAITSFDAGSHDEAIRHVNDLVVGSPDVERPRAFVQAKMYASLAADAVNAREHNKAISLFVQARDCCPAGQCPEMDTISLISGWVFDDLRLTIYRQLCEVCHAAEQTQDVLDTLRQMESNFKDEIKLRRELHGWVISLKLRCTKMLESQGDLAMHNKDYASAVAKYSAALDVRPTVLQTPTLLMKRSEAQAALCLWRDALKDADEAIRLNPSSPWGYQRRHAALHGLKRYEDAIGALKAMISILENSPDPRVRQLRGNYVDPSDTTKAILDAATDCVQNSPFRLIDTTSGLLCDADERKNIFKEDLIFQETVSSMTTQLHQERIDTVTKCFFRYVMLSHRWEAPELTLADVLGKSICDLDASPAVTKLQRFCYLARNAKIRWAWSDTCCIDKGNVTEFEKSINLMFQWYYYSTATIVYLAGVPPLLIRGVLKGSVWMTRGWTLQELLAPRIIRFYYDDWTPYLNDISPNHKESADIMQELEDATGVAANDLLDFRPGLENISVKLRLASTRETTEPADMAYGLFGIFGVKMQVIRGESQQHALGRLFEEIVGRSGDVTCLAWVGQSSEFNSAFPDHLGVYEHPSRTIPHIGEEDMERRVVDLRRAWTREEEAHAISFCQRLNELPAARCAKQHLYLPCIVFRVTALGRVKQTEYRATAKALEDTVIYSGAKILPSVQDLILVCPWIDELLDAKPGRYEEAPSDSDVEPLPGSGPSSFQDLALNSARMDTALKASRLAVRFRQPIGALLLQGLGREQYRRVATDNEIIIRVRAEVSLNDMILQTLDIR